MTRPLGERRGVLCAGSLIADVGKRIDAYPERDHLAVIDEVSLSTGGPGLNLAVDLVQLEAPFPVAVAGLVGDDAHGEFLRAECTRLGVDTGGLRTVEGVATSFTDAMVERDGGRRTFFHHPGADDLLDVDDIDVEASSARILHLGAPGIHARLDAPRGTGNGWSSLLARAQAVGLHTNLELISLDPLRLRGLTLPCLPHLDSLVINDLEAAALADHDPPESGVDDTPDWAALEAIAARLVELGVRRLVVVHFPAGCVAVDASGRAWRQGSVRVSSEDVRSTTGAGDAFAAGVVLGVHEGWPVADSLRLAVAAAAACLRSPLTSAGVLAAGACLEQAMSAGFRPTT